jgi:Flp pilus assembly protein TadG
MKKWWKESALRQQENGMEAIEGLLVITLMLFVLFYIWAFGFLMYQNWAVQYVATDTASRIAQTYGYSSSDPITGYISHATRVSLSPYRYKDDEEEKIQDVNANRAEKYARYSLKKAGFAKEKGLDIEVTTVKDALAASHVEVKVTAQYEIPFGFAMKYFGQSPYREFTALYLYE